jgi:S-disulfanyl-L-cysteine oxidoreductase SoxD
MRITTRKGAVPLFLKQPGGKRGTAPFRAFWLAGGCLVALWAMAAVSAPMHAQSPQPPVPTATAQPPQTPVPTTAAQPPQTPVPTTTAQEPQVPAPAPDQAQAAPTSVLDGVYTPEQAKRGEELYGQFCASCHGPALGGGEMAPALTGGDFATDWIGLTLNDLFERIRVSMPQDQPGALSRQQNADVLAFMLSAAKYPAGKTELPKEAEVLKTIKYEAPKAQPR